jgi:hypothetical protein
MDRVISINASSRKDDKIRVIVICPPGSPVTTPVNVHIKVVHQQIYHDEFLVVLNNVPLQLMQLFDWNLLASKVTQHGGWDTKQSQKILDLGVA